MGGEVVVGAMASAGAVATATVDAACTQDAEDMESAAVGFMLGVIVAA
jgi:hypothetical protein